jgi:YHS domain-containing protein
MHKRYALFPVILLCCLSVQVLAQAAKLGKVKKVDDPKKVCMVTNKTSDKDLIPVKVEDKTYYGCCQMCKTALTNDPSQRSSVDPVSKKQVDKSQAVIGASASGDVLYFESDANLKKYNEQASH